MCMELFSDGMEMWPWSINKIELAESYNVQLHYSANLDFNVSVFMVSVWTIEMKHTESNRFTLIYKFALLLYSCSV